MRVLVPASELGDEGSAAVAALRRRLGVRVPDVRSRVCSFWLKGTCKRGEACAFAHSDSNVNLAGTAAPCPPPIDGLGHPALPRLIGRAMLHLGHREPSAVQAQAWSVALSGRDLLCRAPTGSGKTLAYVLPAFCHVLAQKKPPTPNAGPYVLVLVPTRELAMQVHGVCRGLRKLAGVESAALYGGAPREEQVSAVEAAVGLVVATTGRLLDMLFTKHVAVGRVSLVVFDEADAMVSLGFAPQVSQVCGQLRPDRQTILFSATFPDALEQAAAGWLRAPLRVYVDAAGGDEESAAAAAPVKAGGGAARDGDAELPHLRRRAAARVAPRILGVAAARAQPGARDGVRQPDQDDQGARHLAAQVRPRVRRPPRRSRAVGA